MTTHARGTFEVTLAPQATTDTAAGSMLGMTITIAAGRHSYDLEYALP